MLPSFILFSTLSLFFVLLNMQLNGVYCDEKGPFIADCEFYFSSSENLFCQLFLLLIV